MTKSLSEPIMMGGSVLFEDRSLQPMTIEDAKQVDLLGLAEGDSYLKKKSTDEHSGACPFCGGIDRFSISLTKNAWFCRKCGDDKWGDSISYVMRRDNLEFVEAVRFLVDSFEPPRARLIASEPEVNMDLWREGANAFVLECQAHLRARPEALTYLHDKRGLSEETIEIWQLGLNPEDCFGPATAWGTEANIYLPKGLVIPCRVDGEIKYLNVRTSDPARKYLKIKHSTGWLFGAETFKGSMQSFIFEGEFDALLAWQSWGSGGVGFGSFPANQNLLPGALKHVIGIERFFVSHDMDPQGRVSAWRLAEWSDRIIPVDLPQGNDLGEFWSQDGNVFEWLFSTLGGEHWSTQ